MTDELASATVRIDPDLSYFKAKLEEGLKAETEGAGQDVNITANLDRGGLQTGIAEVDAEMRRIGDATVNVKANADEESFAAVRAKEDAIIPGEKTTTVKADVDEASYAKAELAQDTLNKKLEDTKSAASDAGQGMGALLTAALTVGPALIPVGAALLAGFGALSGVLVAAGAGLGAFAIAAAGQLNPLKVEAGDLLKVFQQMAAPEVIPVIHSALGLLPPLFSQLFPLVGTTATELTHLLDAGKSALEAPFWQSFFGFIQTNAAPALGSLASLFGGVVKGFAGMVEAFGPLISQVEGGLTGMGAAIASWGQTLSSNPGFQNFIAYVEAEGPKVGETLSNIWHVIVNLVAGLAPFGAVALQVVDTLSGFLSTLTGISPVLTSVAAGLVGLVVAFNLIDGPIAAAAGGIGKFFTFVGGLGPLVGRLVGELALLSTAFQIGTISTFGESVALASGPLETLAATLGVAVGGIGALTIGALAVGGALAIVGTGLLIGSGSADQFDQHVKSITASLLALPTNTPKQVAAAIDDTNHSLQTMQDKFDAIYKLNRDQGDHPFGSTQTAEINALTTAMIAYHDRLIALHADQTQINDDLGYLQENFGISRKSAEDLAQSLGINLTKALSASDVEKFGNALHDQATQAGVAESALQHLATTAGTSTAQISADVTKATDTTKKAWASYGDAVTAFSSQTLPPTSAAIGAFYAQQTLQADAFTQNVQKAIQMGFDPRLISQIVQAGPAQASQLLTGLVSSQGTGLQTLIKQSLDAMSKEGALAVEQARETQEAISSKSAAFAAALPTALAASQAMMSTNAAQQLATLASTFSGGLPALQKIATMYGNALPQALYDQVATILNGGKAQTGAQAQGMGIGQPGVDSAAGNAASALPTKIAAQQQASHDAAVANMQRAASGITDGGGMVATNLSAVMSGALITANGAVDWSVIGTAADQGIAAGFAKQANVVVSAAGSVVTQALNSTKTYTIRATSPSKVWAEEIGQPIAEGIAAGIITSGHTISSAADKVTKDAMVVAQHAIVPPRIWNPGPTGGGGAFIPTPTGVNTPPITPPSPFGHGSGQYQVLYNPIYHISGDADPSTVAKWQALQDEHDNNLIDDLYARGG